MNLMIKAIDALLAEKINVAMNSGGTPRYAFTREELLTIVRAAIKEDRRLSRFTTPKREFKAAERKVLCLALNLAIGWESSLALSSEYDKRLQRATAASVKKFELLRAKLES